jgi:hypothetical protein
MAQEFSEHGASPSLEPRWPCSAIRLRRRSTSAGVDLVLLEQVADERAGVAAEEPRGQLGDHRAPHLRLADQRAVDELAALAAVRDELALLHLRQHRRDRRQRAVALVAERLEHVDHVASFFCPEHAQDRVLQVAELVGFRHGCCSSVSAPGLLPR